MFFPRSFQYDRKEEPMKKYVVKNPTTIFNPQTHQTTLFKELTLEGIKAW
jgi:hypothetical protein